MTNLSLDNDTSIGFDSSVALILAKPAPFSIDLSDLLSSKGLHTPSSLSTYDSLSIKAEEDMFRSIISPETVTSKTIQEIVTIEQITPKRVTLGDIVAKRPYNKRPKDLSNINEVKKESGKRRRRVTNNGKETEDLLVKKEKLHNGQCREVSLMSDDKPFFPEVVLKDGKIQINNSTSLKIEESSGHKLEIIQIDKKKITTSISFKQINHTEKWTEQENEKFYRALELFGTEFSMIAKVFKNRNRNQIKNKFLREEKTSSEKVNKALAGSNSNAFHTLLQKYNKIKAEQSQNVESQLFTQNSSKNVNLLVFNSDQKDFELEIPTISEGIDSIDWSIMEDLSDIFLSHKKLMIK